jgi:hypothetical protein
MRRLTRSVALAFSLALVVGGCGGSSDGGMSAAARSRLTPLVRQVRRSAESRDPQGVQRALTDLRRAVASYGNHVDLSAARAAQILAAATQVQGDLALVPTTTTTTTATTTTTTPPNTARGKGDKNGGGPGDKHKGD